MPRRGEPRSSIRPLLKGSLAGCEWMLTRPGRTMRPRPAISRSALPGYVRPTNAIRSSVKARSASLRYSCRLPSALRATIQSAFLMRVVVIPGTPWCCPIVHHPHAARSPVASAPPTLWNPSIPRAIVAGTISSLPIRHGDGVIDSDLTSRGQPMPTAPALGAAIRHEWNLDPNFLTVNHGAYGATPKTVIAAQDEWRRQLETQPSRFFRAVLPEGLRRVADRLGKFLGAEGKDIAFVENATTGCNAVLRSVRFQPGDEIVALSQGYGAVRNTVRYVAERTGAKMVDAIVPFPRPDAETVVANLRNPLSPRTRLAVIDHITSASALVLPVKAMIDCCHAAGVPVLVDGAHGPAQVALDLRALDADWYVGNCHKWLMAPKGAAFLWARPDRQTDLHPVTISHGYNQGYLTEFDWTGTRDSSAFLAVDAAIDFHHRLGGAKLRERNRALAAEGTELLVRRLGTEAGMSAEFSGSMGMIRLPLGGMPSIERQIALRKYLLGLGT